MPRVEPPFGDHEATEDGDMRKRALLTTATTAAPAMAARQPIGAQTRTETKGMGNKELVGRVGYAEFNRHVLSVLDRHVREDYVQHNPLVPQGREGFRRFFADAFRAVPDWRHEAKMAAAEGDLVWVYGTYRGTQKGEWPGIPATGEGFAMDAVDIFRVEGGRLAEHWDVMDVHALSRQLGVMS